MQRLSTKHARKAILLSLLFVIGVPSSTVLAGVAVITLRGIGASAGQAHKHAYRVSCIGKSRRQRVHYVFCDWHEISAIYPV
jgi:hypothetical protein